MQPIRMAFLGFRHGHILALYKLAKARADVAIVAACEEDPATRESTAAGGLVTITHARYAEVLDAVPCDVVAVGDYYARRGPLLGEALQRGKHVISDKPLCTSRAELDEIERQARARNLAVGCQFDLRDTGLFREVRRRLRGGEIGDVHAISFGGQHPLFWGKRAAWYFEPGKQGGTINDLGIHAFDAIPWLTGLEFKTVNCARAWNARLKEVPFFQDAAQVTLTMSNGAGVLGDISYLAPDGTGYDIPQYWRFTFWGAEGLLEASFGAQQLTIWRRDAKGPESLPVPEGQPGGIFDAFLREVRGERTGLALTTAEVLRASRVTLLAQAAADAGQTNVAVG
jgi:predicted dehydrogenase